MKFIELTQENFDKYAKQIVDLCDQAVELNEKNNKSGQFYTSTVPELYGYVTSGKDLVVMAVDENDKVLGAAYINSKVKQNTYSDFTKYFHYFPEFKNELANTFSSIKEYQDFITQAYLEKILIFTKITKEVEQNKELNPNNKSFKELLEEQISQNIFQENNPIRRYITDRLYEEYESRGKVSDYAKTVFYGINDINKEMLQKQAKGKIPSKHLEDIISVYETFLKAQAPVFITEPNIDITKYFNANMDNAMEINTYVVDPAYQGSGLAKIVLYETLKRCMEKYFSKEENTELYLNTTIHNENINSQRTANVIGMTDYLYIEQTTRINRRVYMKQIKKEDYKDLLYDIELELLMEYNYHSENFGIDIEGMRNRINTKIEEYMNNVALASSKETKAYYENKIKSLQSLLDSEINTKRSR